jgi:competence ComEA-like helix-hairpin-helix protein
MTAPFLAIAVMALLAFGQPCPALGRDSDRPPRSCTEPTAAAAAPTAGTGPVAVTRGADVPIPALIAVNRASSEELQQLPGIGPRKAAALVEARGQRPFKRPSDLRRVKGFGVRTVQRLGPLLSFD